MKNARGPNGTASDWYKPVGLMALAIVGYGFMAGGHVDSVVGSSTSDVMDVGDTGPPPVQSAPASTYVPPAQTGCNVYIEADVSEILVWPVDNVYVVEPDDGDFNSARCANY